MPFKWPDAGDSDGFEQKNTTPPHRKWQNAGRDNREHNLGVNQRLPGEVGRPEKVALRLAVARVDSVGEDGRRDAGGALQ